MKRSLGRKSTAPPALRMGRKEGQGNSDSDQPGKAQDLGKTKGNEVPVGISPP